LRTTLDVSGPVIGEGAASAATSLIMLSASASMDEARTVIAGAM
jgi:hypothetical protein